MGIYSCKANSAEIDKSGSSVYWKYWCLYTIRFNYPLSQNTSIVPGSLISKTIDYSIGMRAMNVLRDMSIKLLKLSGVCLLFLLLLTHALKLESARVCLIVFYLLIFNVVCMCMCVCAWVWWRSKGNFRNQFSLCAFGDWTCPEA